MWHWALLSPSVLSEGWWLQGRTSRAFPEFSLLGALHFRSTENPGSRNHVAEEDFAHFQAFSASLEMLLHNILVQPTVVQQQPGLKGLRVALGLVSNIYLSLLFDLKV